MVIWCAGRGTLSELGVGWWVGVQNVCTVELMRARSRLGQFESFLSPSQLRFFVDASGFQLFLNLDLRPLLQMAKASDNYFAERVYKVYVPRIAG